MKTRFNINGNKGEYVARRSAHSFRFAQEEETKGGSGCGSACGSGDADPKPTEQPSACGSSCGAGDGK